MWGFVIFYLFAILSNGILFKGKPVCKGGKKKNVEETKKVVVDFGRRGKCLERNLEEYDKGGGLPAGKLVNQYN